MRVYEESVGHAPPPSGGVKKRAGGRPTVPEAEQRKPLSIRLSDSERKAAQAAATAAGMSLSAYMRELVNGKRVQAVVPEVNRQAYADLARLAGNLNQLTARLNAGGDAGDELPRLLRDTAESVRRLRLELMGIGGDA